MSRSPQQRVVLRVWSISACGPPADSGLQKPAPVVSFHLPWAVPGDPLRRVEGPAGPCSPSSA